MDEFAIHALPVGGGTLAISPLPGRTRHYYADWLRLMDWSPDMVITMVEQHELERKGSGSLGQDLKNAGIVWHHVAVPDFGVPEGDAWLAVQADALAGLARGGKVLAHCFGGCGRSGMVVLRLMIAAGEAPDDALQRLRRVRPCAVETDDQMAWARAERLQPKGKAR